MISLRVLFSLSGREWLRLINIPFGSVEIFLDVAVYSGIFHLQTPTCLLCHQLEQDSQENRYCTLRVILPQLKNDVFFFLNLFLSNFNLYICLDVALKQNEIKLFKRNDLRKRMGICPIQSAKTSNLNFFWNFKKN